MKKNISHYKILEKVGEGGMGVVYKAEDTKLKRPVALKFLPEYLGRDNKVLQRFKQEAEITARLNHPNICTIFDIDEEDGLPFIAMEYIEGQTLDERIGDKPLELEKCISFAIQIARGLGEAHDRRVIHRDIKCTNILVNPKGRCKIMDFGLAQLSTVTIRLTKEGATLGTIAYMSPEQARGDNVDSRSDIWSFGVVLYEMVTGELPFNADYEQAVIYSILNEQPEPATSRNGQLPEKFNWILEKTFAKNPDHRYQHVDEILADLRSIERTLKKEPAAAQKNDIPSLAVLPFVNMNRDEESEFFIDGVTEDIITALSKLKALRVADRNSTFRYKNKTPNLQEVGNTLHVDSVLAGSLRRAGNRLRISIRLSNVSDGYEMWSDRYDRYMEDVFEIQDEISQAVVEALRVELVGDEKNQLNKRYTDDIVAYNFYLKGRHLWRQRTPASLKKAIQCFEQALKEDENYTLALSGKADCYGSLGLLGGFSPEEISREGKTAAQRALKLDPYLAEAYTSMAFMEVLCDWNLEGADQKLQRAEELDPDYPTAPFWRAIFTLPGLGRHEEAVAEARLARKKDPVSPYVNAGMAMVYLFAGQYDRVIEEANKTLELDADYHYTYWVLGRALTQKGDFEQALDVLPNVQGITFRQGALGYACAVSGKKQEAHQILDELSDQPDYLAAWQNALIYAGLGDKKSAFGWLDKVFEAHSVMLGWGMKCSPEFEPLHKDPRWKKLMQKIGLDD